MPPARGSGSAGRNYALEFAARNRRAQDLGYRSYREQRGHRRQLEQYTQHPGYQAGIQGISPVEVDSEWMRAMPAPTRFGDTPTGQWPYVRMAEYNRQAGVVHVVYRDNKEGYYENVDFDTWRAYTRSRSSYLFIWGGGFGGLGDRDSWADKPEILNVVGEAAPNE